MLTPATKRRLARDPLKGWLSGLTASFTVLRKPGSDAVREEQHNTQRLSDSVESVTGNDDTQVELLRLSLDCHEFSSLSLVNSNQLEALEHW